MCVLPNLPNKPHSPALHTRHQLCPFPGSGALVVGLLHHTHAALTLSSTTCRTEAVGDVVSEAVDRAMVTAPPPVPPSSKSRPALLESMTSTPPLYLCVGGGLSWSKEAWTRVVFSDCDERATAQQTGAAATLRLLSRTPPPHSRLPVLSPLHSIHRTRPPSPELAFPVVRLCLPAPLNIKWAAHQHQPQPDLVIHHKLQPTATTMPSPTSYSSSRRKRGVRLLSCVAVAGCCCLVPCTLAFLPFGPPLLSSSSTPGAVTRRPMRASTIKVFTRNLSGGLDPPFFFGTCLNEWEEGAEGGQGGLLEKWGWTTSVSWTDIFQSIAHP